MTGSHEHLPAEFSGIADVLRSQRGQATELELDRIKLDARRRAARRTRSELSQKGLLMRSRLVITALVAGGILMLGGGAALGVSGLSSTRSASIAQYGGGGTTGVTTGVTTGGTTGGGGLNPGSTSGNTTPSGTTNEGTDEQPSDTGVLGSTKSKKPAQAVQAVRQVGGKELPFTGYLAIPVLLMGLAMLGAGVAMRRSRQRLGADS